MESGLIARVKELQLPSGEFLVSGSSILEILGIRKAKDIDLLVSPVLFGELKSKKGWVTHSKYPTAIVHPEGKAEAKQSLDFMKENYRLAELLPKAHLEGGIPFIDLETLLNAKEQLGRDKDIRDIRLINEYFSRDGVEKV